MYLGDQILLGQNNNFLDNLSLKSIYSINIMYNVVYFKPAHFSPHSFIPPQLVVYQGLIQENR